MSLAPQCHELISGNPRDQPDAHGDTPASEVGKRF